MSGGKKKFGDVFKKRKFEKIFEEKGGEPAKKKKKLGSYINTADEFAC